MDWYSPPEYKDYECTECGADIDHEGVCSGTCHEAIGKERHDSSFWATSLSWDVQQ